MSTTTNHDIDNDKDGAHNMNIISDTITNTNDDDANADDKSPSSILSQPGCKIQSLTVSDQHATLLLSHPPEEERRNTSSDSSSSTGTTAGNENNQIQTNESSEPRRTIQSLLKLTIVPFHKLLLGSNPILSAQDIQNGIRPERNDTTTNFNARASQDIIEFLRQYQYCLKSDSGAEYSYHDAYPSRDLVDQINVEMKMKIPSSDESVTANNDDSNDPNTQQQNSSSSPSPPPSSSLQTLQSTLSKFGSFDIELISPATPHQISRAMPSLGHTLIHETPSLYQTITRPFIQSIIDSGSLSWIQNLIDLKKEKERLLVNHTDYIINIDTKWRSHPDPSTTPRKEWYNHPSTSDLYCLAILKQHNIATLRDLKRQHIPILQSLMKEGLHAIQTIYGIPSDQIRVFVHYPPQFYHFHVHFTRLENVVGCEVERGHLVMDIIQNLEMMEDYYERRVIVYKLLKGSVLQNLIEGYCLKNDNDDGGVVDGVDDGVEDVAGDSRSC